MASKKTTVAVAAEQFLGIAGDDPLQFCCGVNEVGAFYVIARVPAPVFPGEKASHKEWTMYYHDLGRWLEDDVEYHDAADIDESGTGYFVATFNEDEASKLAFNRLQELGHKLVYETDPRRNGGGNFVSIGIFLHKDAVERDATPAKRTKK